MPMRYSIAITFIPTSQAGEQVAMYLAQLRTIPAEEAREELEFLPLMYLPDATAGQMKHHKGLLDRLGVHTEIRGYEDGAVSEKQTAPEEPKSRTLVFRQTADPASPSRRMARWVSAALLAGCAILLLLWLRRACSPEQTLARSINQITQRMQRLREDAALAAALLEENTDAAAQGDAATLRADSLLRDANSLPVWAAWYDTLAHRQEVDKGNRLRRRVRAALHEQSIDMRAIVSPYGELESFVQSGTRCNLVVHSRTASALMLRKVAWRMVLAISMSPGCGELHLRVRGTPEYGFSLVVSTRSPPATFDEFCRIIEPEVTLRSGHACAMVQMRTWAAP